MEWRDDVFITNLAKFSTKAPSKEKETQIFVLHLSSLRVSALQALPAFDGSELIRNLINSRMKTFSHEHSTGLYSFLLCCYHKYLLQRHVENVLQDAAKAAIGGKNKTIN